MILRSMVVMSLSLICADACDVVVTLGRDALKSFCHGDRCASDPPPFKVRKNSEICLKDDYGEEIILLVSDIFWKVRYELAYYTSDYTNEVHYTCECCNQKKDEECGVGGPCFGRAKAKLIMKATDKTYYHCVEEDRGFNIYCIFQKPSIRTGPQYEILRYTQEVAMIKLTVNGTNSSHEIKMSSDHHFDLRSFGISSNNFVSITLLNSSSGASSNRSLLRYDDEFFVVESAERQKPTQGLFGDYQVAWDTNNETHVIPYVTCDSKGNCTATCTVPQTSMIRSFQLRKSEFERPDITTEKKTGPSTVQTIETYNNSETFVRLELWGGDLEEKWGKCDVESFGSYGCLSCNDAASVVLKASNVQRIGLVPFRTNCSFESYKIECSSEPTELFLKENATSCHFRMLTQDKEFTVNVQYSTLGRTVKSETRQQQCGKTFDTYGEAFEHYVIDEKFFVTFAGTMISLVLISILFLIFFKLIERRKYYRVTEIGTDLVDL